MERQHTIQKPVTLSGEGLFQGTPSRITFLPAPANHGVVFVRTDLGGIEIPAVVDHVVKRRNRTTLKRGDAEIDMCEHCLSAIAGLRIDNLRIELTGPEVPRMDGSAKPFVDALLAVGLDEIDEPRRRLVVTEPVVVRSGDSMLAATPSDEPEMQVVYELDYTAMNRFIGRQMRVFDFTNGSYGSEIAPSRTFATEPEAIAARKQGLFKHLTPDESLVIGDHGPLGNNHFRFDDEPVRHKVLDLIGDLYLLGAPIQGRIVAYKSGHGLNHQLVKALIKQHRAKRFEDLALHRSELDIRRLFRMMPHRYPMLLVDRVIELDGDRRAVGIKNVTINEPFFQGHYPGTPMMPGVLVVEAMAQLSGVLIAQSIEHVGKLPILLSLDRVKLRKPVTPGDQLVLTAEAIRIRTRIAHMRCKAYVADELAAEAEVKFMMVDDDQD